MPLPCGCRCLPAVPQMNCARGPIIYDYYPGGPRVLYPRGDAVLSSVMEPITGMYAPETFTVAPDTATWGINRDGEALAFPASGTCFPEYAGIDIVTGNMWESEDITSGDGLRTYSWKVELSASPFKITITLTHSVHPDPDFPLVLKWYADEYKRTGDGSTSVQLTAWLGDEYLIPEYRKYFGNSIPCRVKLQWAYGVKFDGTRWNHGHGHMYRQNVQTNIVTGAVVTKTTDKDVEFFTCYGGTVANPVTLPPCTRAGSNSLGSWSTTLAVKEWRAANPAANLNLPATINVIAGPITGDTQNFEVGAALRWYDDFPFTCGGSSSGAIGDITSVTTWLYELTSLDFSTDGWGSFADA